MSGNNLLACPPQLKAIQHYLKLGVDYEGREPVITYWARLYSLQTALKIDKKSPEARTLLAGLMDWLEAFKKNNHDNEAISSDVAGQALLENEANKLFMFADSNDRAGNFNKNVVKSFYTAGVILDVCDVFGELSEEVLAQRKYAKWKATYIHNCLKQGQTPIPGPIGGDEDGPTTGDELGFTVPQGPAPSSEQTSTYNPPVLPTQPSLPPVAASSPAHDTQPAASKCPVSAADIKMARKHCKWADSALDYEDITTAVENLTKALQLLKGNLS
ncbi:vacuolar protein sorting-associated protein VTA1 homolog [Hyalella azteca]|uniref:Vacuolar protein sorting-associated protein VTA1 homolog n=1 Tax=Hyalella azteca TaxID=294128 RepID=A0A8B7MZI7_HYAAZ|nr:vacuolar protein sorting-associated protein VTA1 homolog [Hyalella azteca]